MTGTLPSGPDRPCDRCPRDATRVVSVNGEEIALCETCYQRIVLGR